MKKLVLVGFCAVVLMACGNIKLTSENLAKVQMGMSQAEVEKILGKPTQIETGNMLGMSGTTYTYTKGKTEVKIVFLNDGVMNKSGSFR